MYPPPRFIMLINRLYKILGHKCGWRILDNNDWVWHEDPKYTKGAEILKKR